MSWETQELAHAISVEFPKYGMGSVTTEFIESNLNWHMMSKLTECFETDPLRGLLAAKNMMHLLVNVMVVNWSLQEGDYESNLQEFYYYLSRFLDTTANESQFGGGGRGRGTRRRRNQRASRKEGKGRRSGGRGGKTRGRRQVGGGGKGAIWLLVLLIINFVNSFRPVTQTSMPFPSDGSSPAPMLSMMTTDREETPLQQVSMDIARTFQRQRSKILHILEGVSNSTRSVVSTGAFIHDNRYEILETLGMTGALVWSFFNSNNTFSSIDTPSKRPKTSTLKDFGNVYRHIPFFTGFSGGIAHSLFGLDGQMVQRHGLPKYFDALGISSQHKPNSSYAVAHVIRFIKTQEIVGRIVGKLVGSPRTGVMVDDLINLIDYYTFSNQDFLKALPIVKGYFGKDDIIHIVVSKIHDTVQFIDNNVDTFLTVRRKLLPPVLAVKRFKESAEKNIRTSLRLPLEEREDSSSAITQRPVSRLRLPSTTPDRTLSETPIPAQQVLEQINNIAPKLLVLHEIAIRLITERGLSRER